MDLTSFDGIAARLDALTPEEQRVAVKALQRGEAEVPDVAGLTVRQRAAVVVDRLRLLEISRLRDDAGAATGVLDALRDHAGGRVAVLSGAGISVDAGFPTFRGESDDALWSRYDPMELASIDGYRRDPWRTLRWYCWRRSLGLPAVPSLAHAAIAAAGADVHTQNVDGLHECAGSAGVNRIHGSLWCWRDVHDFALRVDPSDREEDIPTDDAGRPLVRPGVVMFGDFAPTGVYERALAQLARTDVALVVGTASQVSTLWPLLQQARRACSLVVEINPEPSAATHELGALPLVLGAGAGVPLALEVLGAVSPAATESLTTSPRSPLRDVLPTLTDQFLADA